MIHLSIENPTIHIIGAGGTGGYLLEHLAKLWSNQDFKPTIHIYDGDRVEHKNLLRQNFIKEDVDQFKVQALAERFKQNFFNPPSIIAHDAYITDADELLADLLLADGTPIIISAVDNVATRKLIYEAYEQFPDLAVLIDSGNDDLGGQVVWTSNQPVTYKPDPFGQQTVQLKSMFEIYPNLLDIEDENPGISHSCADVSEDYPQAMMCNVRNADIIALITHSLAIKGSIGYNWYRSQLDGITKADTNFSPC